MVSLVARILSLVCTQKIHTRVNKHNVPLPKICHLEINDEAIGERPVFVIGDVHGCLDEMCELMDTAEQEHNPVFIFVGDLVNKGPDSVGVIRKLRAMVGSAYSVRGNHDEGALHQVRLYKSNTEHVLREQYEWIKGLEDADIEFLSQLPYTISIPTHKALIVHAGIVPGKPLEQQELNALTNMRNIVDKGDPFCTEGLVGQNHTKVGVAWASLWPGPEHVYFGHDARRGLQRCQYATGLDTGCCYGGNLTGVFLNKGRKMLQVKSRQPNSFDD